MRSVMSLCRARTRPHASLRTADPPTYAVPPAAFTIASSGNLPAAIALSRSYLAAHPGHRFHLIVAGPMPELRGLDPRTRVVAATDVPVPHPATFRYQYAIHEACAALKPHAIAWLLEDGATEELLYLGPETFVFRPLEEAWAALAQASIVLAPRLRAAFPDREFRAESALARSQGVFDNDFIGVRKTPESAKLLDWWARELFVDCVDDPAHGFHLDRRCLDQAPWLFEGVEVLRDPAYGVGAWNLLERRFECVGDTFLVDGRPLALFNFRGRDAAAPGTLAAANRMRIEDVPGLARLIALRDGAVAEAGALLAGPLRDDPPVLANGIPMVRALTAIVLQAARRKLQFPEPGSDADGFCRFAARPDAAAFGAPVAPVVSALLMLRPDVAAAFPDAGRDPADPGLLDWLRRHGAREEGLGPFLERCGAMLASDHPVAVALELRSRRPDLVSAFPVFDSDAAHRAFADWLATHGKVEAGLDHDVAAAFAGTAGASIRVLDAWFSDPARALDARLPHTDEQQARIVRVLGEELWRLPGIDHGDLVYFVHAARERREALLLCWLRYNPAVRRAIGGPPSIFRREPLRRFLETQGAAHFWPRVATALLSPGFVSGREQLAGILADSADARALFPDAGHDARAAIECTHYLLDEYGMDDRQPGWSGWARQLLETTGQPDPWLNVCGPLRDASGVGEAARALLRSLDAAGCVHARAVMPGAGPGHSAGATELDLYGSVDPGAAANLLVANADARTSAETWFGDQFREGQARIAVWMWETEVLPARFADAAAGLDAIIAPSRFAARAIRATVDIPVHIVPLPPDFEALDRAMADRARFGLPPDAFLIGYFFDANSVIERKNPAAVIDAFRMAFGDRSDACLVLKVNAPPIGDYDYALLVERAAGLNVEFVGRTLSRQDTFDLMASLDAYISLHRAEGFGLTLAEAMALGKPCIATGYSGNLDFMDDGCAMLVRHRRIVTRRPHGAYPVGSHWSEPSIEDAARHMRVLRDDAGARARLGRAARDHVRRVLDPAVAGAQLARVCREAARGRAAAKTP